MNQKKTLLILILALVVLITAAGVLYNDLSSRVDTQQLATQGETVTVPAGTAPGAAETEQQYAPDFTVYDLDGNAYRLSDFRGTPVVLNFWASWCGPCKMEMPDFDEKARALVGQVQFLMVNLTDGAQETVASASAFVAQEGYTFPVFYDTQQSAALSYGVYSIPTTYFIDAEGYAVAYASGAISADLLQTGIDMICE
ncbi:MAG: TlpA family protein disulfide reductase [Oscillospiraceae bacterium]|nr:TlpA family protein disulfide reductase [Oscillospiraceae bacterium]